MIFFVAPDSTTARGDDYILFEQVNGGPPDMVSRNIIGSPTTVYFDYYRLASVAGTLSIDSLPAARLPLVHTVPIHLAPADTGAAAVIDSIRGIRVTFTVTNGLSGAAERRYTLVRFMELPNIGIASRRTCGDAPILGTALTASSITQTDGTPAVRLAWNPATDEYGGEKDVGQYVIWRKRITDVTWGTPYLSLPAGSPAYPYDDAPVPSRVTHPYPLPAPHSPPSPSPTTPPP